MGAGALAPAPPPSPKERPPVKSLYPVIMYMYLKTWTNKYAAVTLYIDLTTSILCGMLQYYGT
jgi:hypothetical protein